MILPGLIIVIPYSEFLEGGRKFTHRALIFQSKDMAVLCLSQYVVIYLIETIGVSKTDISTHLGVTAKGNRTLNNWLGNSEQQIPYTAWRKLLSLAGLSIDLMVLSVRAEGLLARKAKQLAITEDNASASTLLREVYNVLDHGTSAERLILLDKLKLHFK
ncbi:hypothetical protein UB41_19830 [Photobacterium phosphoreum]|nr:hypothetical protein UB41_19830 [Photobacterium phosphoreum]